MLLSFMYSRVNINIMWNIFQILPVIFLIVTQAAGRHESLTAQNMERKARWREEARKEREAAAALSEKAQ